MPNASFSGTTAALSVSFDALSKGFSDKGSAVEEWHVPILVSTAADWGALFAMRTPREFLSIRFCPSGAGNVTTTIDCGGGAGPGDLAIDTLDGHSAYLTDLESQAPIGAQERRLAMATFVVAD